MWARGRTITFALFGVAMAGLLAYTAWLSHVAMIRAYETYDEGAMAARAVFEVQAMLRNLLAIALAAPFLMIWHLIDFKTIDKKAPFTLVAFVLVALAAFLCLGATSVQTPPTRVAATVAMASAATALALFVGVLWALGLSFRAGKVLREQGIQR